jgi:hypothetical protein
VVAVDGQEEPLNMKWTASKEHRKALRVGLAFQVVFGVIIWFFLPDRDQLYLLWFFSMLVYWGTFIVMVSRNPDHPSKAGLFLIRWGFPLLFFINTSFLGGLVGIIREYLN